MRTGSDASGGVCCLLRNSFDEGRWRRSQYLIICEADDENVTFFSQYGRPLAVTIVRFRRMVDRSVHLDGEPCRRAVEIRDVMPDNGLPLETPPTALSSPQQSPKGPLRFGLLLPQSTRGSCHRADRPCGATLFLLGHLFIWYGLGRNRDVLHDSKS
jgi:hypothetical protein